MKISQLDKQNFYFVSLKVEPFDFEDYNLYHPNDEAQENVKYYAERSVITSACIGYINKNQLVVKVFETDEKSVLLNLLSSIEKFEGRKLAGWGVANNILPFIIKRCIINNIPVPSIFDFGDIAPWSKDFLDVQKIWSFGALNYPFLDEVHKALVPSPIDVDERVNDIYRIAEIFLRVAEGNYIENVEVREDESKTS